MVKLNWQQFSRSELIAILEAMEEHVWLVEKLDADESTVGIKSCSCDLDESPLPPQLRTLCRVASTRRRKTNPLAHLLRLGRRTEDAARRQTG